MMKPKRYYDYQDKRDYTGCQVWLIIGGMILIAALMFAIAGVLAV